MPYARTETERRRRAFLHAVAAGRSVTEAAEHAGIPWSTLYSWRDKSAAFHAAWKRAAERAKSALADRLQAALIQRAVEGVDEPVYHDGHCIGFRKRYSDALLLAGLRELTPDLPAIPVAPRAAEPETPDRHKRVTVVIEPLDPEDDEPLPGVTRASAPAIEAPAPRVVVTPEPYTPPDPKNAPALNWAHLGRNE